MKKIIIMMVIGLCVASLTASAFAQDSALRVAGFEGNVQVKISSSAEWIDATVGQALNPSDSIKTGENGQAMLQFSDKSTVALKPNTEIIVEELAWTETARKAGLNMPIGELRVVIKKMNAPSDFKVRTPTAICGARGTVFYVMTTGTETRVFVTEGAIDFTNPASNNTYVVIENMSAISELNGTVTEPRELTGEEREQALAGWSGVITEPYVEPPSDNDPAGDGAADNGSGSSATLENPAADNKGQQEGPVSPI